MVTWQTYPFGVDERANMLRTPVVEFVLLIQSFCLGLRLPRQAIA